MGARRAGTLVRMAGRERSKDIYDRRPTSTSRGKTHERIMALQHAPGMIPGAEQVLADPAPGSIAAAICGFHTNWVEPKPVTTRRAYERSLAFFARDLDANGPALSEPATVLEPARLEQHLDWRLTSGLADPGEIQRSALHLARLAEWIDAAGAGVDPATSDAASPAFVEIRATMRAAAASRIAKLPPAYHVATAASELRDTSADADLLDGDG